MRRVISLLVTVVVLFTTALLLVADSARKCSHPAQTVTFEVTGTCGPPGRVTIHSDEDACGLTVAGGEAVGLPADGELGSSYDLRDQRFDLNGTVVVSGAALDGGTDGGSGVGSLPDGGVELTRYCVNATDGGSGFVCEDEAACEFQLTPEP